MNVAQTQLPNFPSASNSLENIASSVAPSAAQSSFEQVLGASSSNTVVGLQESVRTGQTSEAAGLTTGSVALAQTNGLRTAPDAVPSNRGKVKLASQNSEAGSMEIPLSSEEQAKKKSEKKAEKNLATEAGLGILLAPPMLPMAPEIVSASSETAISSISAVRARGGAALALHLGLSAEHRLAGAPQLSSPNQASNQGVESATNNALLSGLNSDQPPGIVPFPQIKLVAIQAALLDSGANDQGAEPMGAQTALGASTPAVNQEINPSQDAGSPNPSLSETSILPSQISIPAGTSQLADAASIRSVAASGEMHAALSPTERAFELKSAAQAADPAGTQTGRLNQSEATRPMARISQIVTAPSAVFGKAPAHPSAAGLTNTEGLIESPNRGAATGTVVVNAPAKPLKVEGKKGKVPTAIVQASAIIEGEQKQPADAAQSVSPVDLIPADLIIEAPGSAPAVRHRPRPDSAVRPLIETPGRQTPEIGRAREVISRQLLNPLAANNHQPTETKFVSRASTSVPVGTTVENAFEIKAISPSQRDVNTVPLVSLIRDVNGSPLLPSGATLTSAAIPHPVKSAGLPMGKPPTNATEVNAKSDSPGDANNPQGALRASVSVARPSIQTGPLRTAMESPNTLRRAAKLDGFGPTRLASGAEGDFVGSVENSLSTNVSAAWPADQRSSLTDLIGSGQKNSISQELEAIRSNPSLAVESLTDGIHDPRMAAAASTASDAEIPFGNESTHVIPSSGAANPVLALQGASQKSNSPQPQKDAASELANDSDKVVRAAAANDLLEPKSELTALAANPLANTRNDRPKTETGRVRGLFEHGLIPVHSSERLGLEGTMPSKGSNASGILDAQQRPDMLLTAHHDQETDSIRKNIPGRGSAVPGAEQILPPEDLEWSSNSLSNGTPSVDALLRMNSASLVDARRMERGDGALVEERITGLHRQVAEGIWSAVETFRASGPQDWIIRIRPDTGTDLNLRMKMQDNQLVIHARLDSGNWDAVAPKWGELQSALLQRGVELRPLESALDRTSVRTDVGQFGSGQQESRPQQFGSDLEELVESAPPLPQAPIRSERAPVNVSSGRDRKLESWA